MKPIIDILEKRVTDAMARVTQFSDCSAIVKPAADARFGDYQANGVMAIAKVLKANPRQLAQKIVDDLDLSDICQEPEVAGPGFINLRLKAEFLAETLLEINSDVCCLGIEKTGERKTIVVDFSGPNIAKQMHVGHLRSTIIGDCICRLLESSGHNVIRQNHIGDWGTQFGMLIAYLKAENPEILRNPESVRIGDLEEFYRAAKQRCDTDAGFADDARRQVIDLHNRNSETIRIWQHIVDESRNHYQPIYQALGVNLDSENECGESFYADRLAGVVDDLRSLGLAEESDGAICVFAEGFANKDGQPLPLIIQKSDGAFLYATTDLAAIRYRVEQLKADRIIYVTDARQGLHFQMVFAVARLAGWVGEDVELVHVTFGSVLGEDGKPLKTREGKNIKLRDLLDESIARAKKVVEAKNAELDDQTKAKIADAVGIGAVKYADYSNNRTSDYIFSFDKMLSMEGNTAPYLQYAYARIKSIERKAAANGIDIDGELKKAKNLNLTEPAELDLAKHLCRYSEAIVSAAMDYRPNYITSYIYELAQKFSVFYNNCPVLIAGAEKRPTRLILCDLTAKTMQNCLNELLGIKVVEQM